MKTIILSLFTILLLTFTSCIQSKEDKARNLIEDQLKKTMNDWNSYEFVEMTPLDSSFSIVSDNEEYHNLELKFEVLKAKSHYFLSEYEYDYTNAALGDSCDACIKEMESVTQKMKEIEDSFVSEHNGWWTTFTCRGNNKLGHKVISSTKYYFNKDLTAITDAIDVE